MAHAARLIFLLVLISITCSLVTCIYLIPGDGYSAISARFCMRPRDKNREGQQFIVSSCYLQSVI
jgi:hypothetical protein